MAKLTKEDREELSKYVDKEFWGGRRKDKDTIEAIAEKEYGPCLKKLWEPGVKADREAYRKCVEETNLRAKYKDFWGKGGETGE